MWALKSKFLGPTKFRGSRIRVSDGSKSLTVSYESEHTPEVNHQKAMRAFILKFWPPKKINSSVTFSFVLFGFAFFKDEGVGLVKCVELTCAQPQKGAKNE